MNLEKPQIQRLHVAARYSEAAVFNGVVYLAGMVPECEATDIKSQTADVLAQIDTRLAEVGSDKSRLLRVQIYLSDIRDIHGRMGAGRPRSTSRHRTSRPRQSPLAH
jgi:enamine deaminase RidA (YjgF/YER057c/UK114 family)